MNNIYEALINKQAKLSVIGLGYVGLPIALEFSKHINVVGFDVKPERVAMMNNHIDPSNELDKEAFDGCNITFTSTEPHTHNVFDKRTIVSTKH